MTPASPVRRLRRYALAIPLLVLLSHAPAATAAIDLQSSPIAARVDGVATNDSAAYSVAGAGDVNGDGIDDLVVGAPTVTRGAHRGLGSAYVVYGGHDLADVDLQSLAGAGFQITGMDGDVAGWAVAAAGDVNGDGIGDLLVGAPFADPYLRAGAGASYVIYGQRTADPADVDLDLIKLSTTEDARAMIIAGGKADDSAGYALAPAGDVNADGIDDVIVGSVDAFGFSSKSGAAYVVYGEKTADPADVDLDIIDNGDADAARGLRINGQGSSDQVGGAVAGAGDVNGDGVDDVIVGAPGVNGSLSNVGAAYIIYGTKTADPADVEINDGIGARGMYVEGVDTDDAAGLAVSGAGDFNGDGIDDVAVGALAADTHGRRDSGAVYVIYGRRVSDPADLKLADITTTQAARGLRIDGALGVEAAGAALAHGDFDGDGVGDLLLGAPGAGNNERLVAGSAYVVHGQAVADPADLDLAKLTTTESARGERFDGAAPKDGLGYAVAAGDLDGDGRDDVILGAPNASNSGRASSGSAYVLLDADRDGVRNAADNCRFVVNPAQGNNDGDPTGDACDADDDNDGTPDDVDRCPMQAGACPGDATGGGAGGGGGGTALPDRVAPTITGAKLTNRRFAVAKAAPAARPTKAKVKRGTTVRLTLSERASLTLRVQRRAVGRRRGRSCVAATKQLIKAKARRCIRYTPVGTLTRRDAAAAVTIAFSGRIGRTALRKGSYRFAITATDAAKNTSATRLLGFTVVSG